MAFELIPSFMPSANDLLHQSIRIVQIENIFA
jgi:hypothetical protein